jgi:hypothetical protein
MYEELIKEVMKPSRVFKNLDYEIILKNYLVIKK